MFFNGESGLFKQHWLLMCFWCMKRYLNKCLRYWPLYKPRNPSFVTVFLAQSHVPVYKGTPFAPGGTVCKRTCLKIKVFIIVACRNYVLCTSATRCERWRFMHARRAQNNIHFRVSWNKISCDRKSRNTFFWLVWLQHLSQKQRKIGFVVRARKISLSCTRVKRLLLSSNIIAPVS